MAKSRSTSRRINTRSECTQKQALTNLQIAELLAREAEGARPPLNRAFRRASRRAFMWPEEAATLVASGRSLTEFPSVGPFIEKLIKRWIADSPPAELPPEVRRGFLTLTDATQTLASDPELRSRVKGDLQMHTTWSDGTASIGEMADAAEKREYEYIAVTDHAKGLKIAGGINEQQLDDQSSEIGALNKRLKAGASGLQVLRSIELNLNPRGEGDMEEASLDRLDIVLGCFHSSLRKKEDQTERYLAALRNPTIQILGHPRGRIYNFRLGLTADWSRVFALAAELDKALEIDCYPDRQDLSPDLLAIAKKEGCRISLGTDAHGPTQLGFIEFGMAAATAAGIPPERVLNTMSREKLLSWVAEVRDRNRS